MARRRRKVKKRVCAIPRAPNGSAFFNWYEKQPFVSRARELDNKHQEALKQEADEIIKGRGSALFGLSFIPFVTFFGVPFLLVLVAAGFCLRNKMQWIFGESVEFSK
ncbi:hypothetical protein QL285_058553 [Trifolium repens]|nr:hypothetical protein QL285_058553 [Trifolium repens]